MDILTDETKRFLTATAPEHDDVQSEMASYANEHGFPIIGPEAGLSHSKPHDLSHAQGCPDVQQGT